MSYSYLDEINLPSSPRSSAQERGGQRDVQAWNQPTSMRPWDPVGDSDPVMWLLWWCHPCITRTKYARCLSHMASGIILPSGTFEALCAGPAMWEDKADRALIPLLTRQISGTRLSQITAQQLIVFGTGMGCGAGEVYGLPDPHRDERNQVRKMVTRHHCAHRTSRAKLMEEFPWFQEYISGNAVTVQQWSSSTQVS